MAEATFAHDLHVLSTPPAFILSQDQTLQFGPSPPRPANGLDGFIRNSRISVARLLFFLYLVFKEPTPFLEARTTILREPGSLVNSPPARGYNLVTGPTIPAAHNFVSGEPPERGRQLSRSFCQSRNLPDRSRWTVAEGGLYIVRPAMSTPCFALARVVPNSSSRSSLPDRGTRDDGGPSPKAGAAKK